MPIDDRHSPSTLIQGSTKKITEEIREIILRGDSVGTLVSDAYMLPSFLRFNQIGIKYANLPGTLCVIKMNLPENK